jgi:hypothetical protein
VNLVETVASTEVSSVASVTAGTDAAGVLPSLASLPASATVGAATWLEVRRSDQKRVCNQNHVRGKEIRYVC